jgi:hypothetical protein
MGLLDDLLRPGPVFVVLPRDGTDLLGGEVVRKLAQCLLLVGEGEIDHWCSPLFAAARLWRTRPIPAIDWSVNAVVPKVT